MPTTIDTAVSPIPEPKTTNLTLPVVGSDVAEVKVTVLRSDLTAELKLPTLPDCEMVSSTKAAFIAFDLVQTDESLIQKCDALEVPPMFTKNELL